MRSFLVDYFFKYEKSTPLESFKKFTKGKITDLEVTLKKQPSKRKSESAPGIGTKKSKIDLDTINENQEKLKTSKKAFLEAIAKKEGLSQHLIDNPVIEKASKFKEIMSDWNREEPCKICKESWFDQDYATRGPNIGICQRC